MQTFFLHIIVCFAAMSFITCNENLPVREDISNLVTTHIRSSYETTSHSIQTGKIRIFVTMVNKTDETLDDIAQLSGLIEVTWQIPKDLQPNVDVTRTIRLTADDLFYAKSFNRQTKRLTIDPNDSVVVSVVWNLKSNDSTYVLSYFPWKEETIVSPCRVLINPYPGYHIRRVTMPQRFAVKANIKIFDNLAVLYVQPITVKHCFMLPHNGYGPEATCADFILFDPCYVIEQ